MYHFNHFNVYTSVYLIYAQCCATNYIDFVPGHFHRPQRKPCSH